MTSPAFLPINVIDQATPLALPRKIYDINCRQCSRLAVYLDAIKLKYPSYFCRPVSPFGDANAQLILVGLAPSAHGANQTGRPYTGSFAGKLLYQTLYKYGFASQPDSVAANDSLTLINCRLTDAVKCAPPQNNPLPVEISTCNQYLSAELNNLTNDKIILALGVIAHGAVIKAFNLKMRHYKFGHANRHTLPNGIILIDSYHCSRYNTQTKRLTAAMFEQIFCDIKQLLKTI